MAGSLIPPPLLLYTIVLCCCRNTVVCSALCCAELCLVCSRSHLLSASHEKGRAELARRRSFGLGTWLLRAELGQTDGQAEWQSMAVLDAPPGCHVGADLLAPASTTPSTSRFCSPSRTALGRVRPWSQD